MLDLRPSKTIDYKGELRLLHQHSRALSHARDRTLYETCTQLGLGVGLVGWHDDEPNVIEEQSTFKLEDYRKALEADLYAEYKAKYDAQRAADGR